MFGLPVEIHFLNIYSHNFLRNGFEWFLIYFLVSSLAKQFIINTIPNFISLKSHKVNT